MISRCTSYSIIITIIDTMIIIHHLWRQERRMQSTLSASDGISVLHDGGSSQMPGGFAGSVLSGLLLAAATYAAVTQVRSWLERRQVEWQAGIFATLPTFLSGLVGRAPLPDNHFGDTMMGDESSMDTLWNLPAEPGLFC